MGGGYKEKHRKLKHRENREMQRMKYRNRRKIENCERERKMDRLTERQINRQETTRR